MREYRSNENERKATGPHASIQSIERDPRAILRDCVRFLRVVAYSAISTGAQSVKSPVSRNTARG